VNARVYLVHAKARSESGCPQPLSPKPLRFPFPRGNRATSTLQNRRLTIPIQAKPGSGPLNQGLAIHVGGRTRVGSLWGRVPGVRKGPNPGRGPLYRGRTRVGASRRALGPSPRGGRQGYVACQVTAAVALSPPPTFTTANGVVASKVYGAIVGTAAVTVNESAHTVLVV